ncbi:MAG: glycoside hydrolase family 88 protein [Carboxylicivirga sp.]|jgi:rhamnogalacturonyl hydrolase YesR|nr:glycoside hydrolase family 88 protein [Carboxylicivirga sp.]MCT4646970.1 glycoside hydrolase family 88 protein [Carboxylicivirga sp.]
MKKRLIFALAVVVMAMQLNAQEVKKSEVYEIMDRVASWQCQQELKHRPADWTNGALYAGMMAWAKMAEDERYIDWLIKQGETCQWSKMPRAERERYHADDYAVGMMYLEMYRLKKDKKMLQPMKEHLDYIIANPSSRSMDHNWWRDESPAQRWTWCDALFMAPTVFAKMYSITGERKYLEFMNKEYRVTTDFLYDHVEHLYYRDSRYFHQKEPNGKKMFWGRGNGWVFGGLAIILPELKDNYPEKMWYEKLFTDMAHKIASLQDENGYWHASMLDQESYPNPETSSTGFFVYGLAWGINNGYLDREKYLPVVLKGWKALTEAVYPDGKLGWVQPIGENPKKTKKSMTEVYGVGAFLKAGSEVYKLAE